MTPIDLGDLPVGSRVSNYLYPDLDPQERHQDLVTIELPTGYRIYVGWFPEYEENGEYWIRAAWSTGEIEPIKTRSLSKLQSTIKTLIEYYSRPKVFRTASTTVRAEICTSDA